MSKRKYDIRTIKHVLEQLTAGLKSSSELAKELSLNKSTINDWLLAYEKYGVEYFNDKQVNSAYTKEFKINVIKEFFSGSISQRALCIKYNISAHSVLRTWIKMYNEGKEFEDYVPSKGIYLMKCRKTTKEEKIEIVEFCISNNFNYKLAAEKYVVPYSQVYQWVQKHKTSGNAGLGDNRGRKKLESELSEMEKLKRELEETKRRLEYAQLENEILKKKEEIELRQIFQKPSKK